MGAQFDANCQYTGHSKGGGVKGQVYGRRLLNLNVLKSEVTDKIDWQKYCGWAPNLALLKKAANGLLINKMVSNKTDLKTKIYNDDLLTKGQL